MALYTISLILILLILNLLYVDCLYQFTEDIIYGLKNKNLNVYLDNNNAHGSIYNTNKKIEIYFSLNRNKFLSYPYLINEEETLIANNITFINFERKPIHIYFNHNLLRDDKWRFNNEEKRLYLENLHQNLFDVFMIEWKV
jgi:hypothetical protein